MNLKTLKEKYDRAKENYNRAEAKVDAFLTWLRDLPITAAVLGALATLLTGLVVYLLIKG